MTHHLTLILSVAAALLAIGYANTPVCRCPYRRRFFLYGTVHDSTSRMALLVLLWSCLFTMDLDEIHRPGEPGWLRAFDGLLVTLAIFYIGWTLLRIYYHEYPGFRRLRRLARDKARV